MKSMGEATRTARPVPVAISAIGAGLTVGLVSRGNLSVLTMTAIPLAAMNGYSKAYSP